MTSACGCFALLFSFVTFVVYQRWPGLASRLNCPFGLIIALSQILSELWHDSNFCSELLPLTMFPSFVVQFEHASLLWGYRGLLGNGLAIWRLVFLLLVRVRAFP